MASSLSEQLFDAINLIASKKVSNLPYDQTIVCTITDNANAANGEYTVTDGTTEFVTYSENPDYRVNTRVYVNIPNNDRLNKTHITGEYIEDENGNYQTYISPMNNFVDLTGDLIPADINSKEFSLLANDPQRTFITVWRSPSGKVYRNYTCLGIQGNFRTNFPADTPTIGNYGLAVYIDYTTADGTAMSKVLYFDCSEMFGNPYNFTTDYLQEKLFDISGMDIIDSIQIAFYQSKNFEIIAGTPLEYADLQEDNLFVNGIQVRIGELLTKYETDTVKLICNDALQYKYDEEPLSRRMYLRWIHKITNGLMVIDQNEDQELDSSLMTTYEGSPIENYVVRWYHYNLTNGVHDDLAGNFWEQMADDENPWQKDIIPNDKTQYDRFKVIIEYPNSTALRSNLLSDSEDFAVLLEAAKTAAQAGGINPTVFTDCVRCYVLGIPYPGELDADGHAVMVDFYTKWCEDEAVPALYNNTDIANLRAYITEQLSQIQYYESDIVSFENKVQVDLENVDLIQGLNIIVDADDGGHHGVYRLYDETNNIINTNESRKVRHMTATYTSIALGIDSLDQAEEIMWCFPLEQTMIQLPQEGYEYNTENGDEYFEVDAFNETSDASAAQAQRIAEAERYDAENGTDWHTCLDFTAEQLQAQLTIEINKLDVTRFANYEAYWARVKALQRYYQLQLEILISNEYRDEIISFAAEKGKWGVIRRTGTEIVSNELGEQLIEVGQDFRIKSYYVDNFTNNNIVCLVKRNKRVYQAVATLHFASLGTSGTEATFFLTMCDEDGYQVGGLVPGGSITIRPYLYDYNNQPIDFESQVGYKWYSEPVGKYVTVDGKQERQEVIEMTQSGNDLLLMAREDMDLSDAAHAILQAQVQYTISYTNGKKDDATAQPEEKQRTVTLTTYLPIPMRVSTEVTHISGATKIIYDSNGTNPTYYKDGYEIHTYHKINTDDIEWELIGEEINDPITGRYYPTLSSNYEIVATNMYFDNIKPISAVATGIVEGLSGPQEIWVQPILIMQNRYGSAMMNNWDGSLQIDEENGTILSQMVGAGVKNEDNTFSGVLMGNVALADEKIGNKTGLGLYGFHHGEQAFGLNVDGTAFFGKAGSGRIEFDGNKGTIQSYNYQEPHAITMYGDDGDPLEQEEGEVPNTRVTETGSGLKIDLDDSTISAYGKTGSLIINTNKYGQPLFVIRDADYLKNSNGNTLFYVSSAASDPTTGITYDAKYFLQSANYTGTDPDDLKYDEDDEDAPDSGYATGALFDLEKGKLDIHGKAGRVFIHGDGSNDLFQIRGWKGTGSNFIKNTIMNVSPNRYYLQSLDYKANKKGFKMDIASGKMMASDFNLKAGNDSDGMIQLTTSGMPYFSITTGIDYIEEKLADGSIVYACYDAIDLEDVDAQFEPNTYWVKNQNKPGYYAVEGYQETLGNYPSTDSELYKQNFYYRYKDESVQEEDRVLIDANMKKITVYDPETWNFANTLLPDQPRLYQRLPNPIVLDEEYFFTRGRQYYADAEGNQPVTLYDNSSYYKFKELRAAGTLYRQNLTPMADDGSKGWQEGRIYYTCDNPTAAEKDRKYTAVRHIVPNHNEYEIWVANKYYYKTVIGKYARSVSGFAGEQDYYEPKDASTNSLTAKQVLNLTDDAFKKTSKTIVFPDTYFYDTPASDGAHELLFYYNDDWEQVGANENWSANYKYGIKYENTSGTIRAVENVVDDERFIYSANKWYYEKEEEKYEALDKWMGADFTYYYLWYDIYLKAEKVIEKETSTKRIFEPNKYYRYIANKKFLLAADFYGGEKYYNASSATLEALDLDTQAGQDALDGYEILLCDVNSQPYKQIAEDGFERKFQGQSSKIKGFLHWLDSSGVYNPVAVDETTGKVTEAFSADKEYYLRYKVGTKDPDSGTNSLEGTSGIHSVKLVNITKGGFELKSHNWYTSKTKKTGLHLYISSNSRYDDDDSGIPQEQGGDDPTEFSDTTAGALANEGISVGGGYIEGYGFYKATTKDPITKSYYRYPRFIIDWRAGASHYPINVNDVFKVYWNGRVDCTDIHSLKGTIGGWYIDKWGLYSFKPPADHSGSWMSTGVALLSSLSDQPAAEGGLGNSYTIDNQTAHLRIGVGTFNGNGYGEDETVTSESETDVQDEYITSSDSMQVDEVYYDYAIGIYITQGEGDNEQYVLKTNGGIPVIRAYKNQQMTQKIEQQLTETFRSQAEWHNDYYTYNGKYYPYASYLNQNNENVDANLFIKTHTIKSTKTYIIYTNTRTNKRYRMTQNGNETVYVSLDAPDIGQVFYELPNGATGTQHSQSITFHQSNKYGFFVYNGGQVQMYKAYIDSANVQNGTITKAKIDTCSINAAIITGDCAVKGTLNGGTIKGSLIDGSTITGGTITGGTVNGGTITGATINAGIITGGTITGATINAASLTASNGQIGGATIGANSLSWGQTSIGSTGVMTHSVIAQNGIFNSAGISDLGCTTLTSESSATIGGTLKVSSSLTAAGVTAEGSCTFGATTCDTLTVGGKTINADMASLDAEGMKTQLGLKALAFADDVSKKVNVSVTGSVKVKVSYGSYYESTPKYTDANGNQQSVSGTWYKKHSSNDSTTITITLSGSGSKEYTFAPDGSGDAASITVKFSGATYTSNSTSTATVTME